jgi:protein MpaA
MKLQKVIRRVTSLAFVSSSLWLGGCNSMHVDSGVAVRHLIIGKSVDGRPIRCDVYSGAHQHETILMLASIHGDEHVGTLLLEMLGDYLRAHPDLLANRRVLLVPEVNPDGVVHQQRRNAHGIDLNRNFPARNWSEKLDHGAKPLSEPESRAVRDLIVAYHPTRILSLHQPLNCMDYDGPAKVLAEAMAAVCDLPLRKVGALDGSLGSYAGEQMNIPIVTVEFTAEASDLDHAELWRRYGKMLLTATE